MQFHPCAILFLKLCSLAKAEMLLAISKVFRQLKFELYETTIEDVTMVHEMFLAFPKATSKGVRVVIKD